MDTVNASDKVDYTAMDHMIELQLAIMNVVRYTIFNFYNCESMHKNQYTNIIVTLCCTGLETILKARKIPWPTRTIFKYAQSVRGYHLS